MMHSERVGEIVQERLQLMLVAHQDDIDPPVVGEGCALNDLERGPITTHRVDSDAGHGDQTSATTVRPL
jgi:hypothetical protein